MPALLFFILVLWPTLSFGSEFYHSPNFRGFSESQAWITTTSKYYDSETESDYLTYSPINCERQRLLNQAPNFFCTSMGSLGSKRFLIDSALTLTQPILPKVLFRLHWIQNQNYSEDTTALAPELLFPLSEHHALGFHGQVDTRKSKDDIGASYNLSLNNFWMRLEANAFDFSRNQRNENADRFSQYPYTFSLMTLKMIGQDLYSLNYQVEPQFIWNQGNGVAVSRSRSLTSLTAKVSENILTLDYLRSFLDISTDFEDHSLLRAHWEKQMTTWKPGLRLVHKSWSTSSGKVTHQDALPFVWFHPDGRWTNFNLGYEFTLHHTKVEHRANVAWKAIATENASLKFLFTFDLDRFGSGETWEGGNGQFSLVF